MNRLTLEIVPNEDPVVPYGVEILIDGCSLAVLAKVAERPSATLEGCPEMAGEYFGVSPADVVLPSRHFWGRPACFLYDYGDGTQILGCDCGDPMCWPLICRIVVSPEQIIWSDFRQVRRPKWDHSNLGPFVFARSQYEAEVEKLSA